MGAEGPGLDQRVAFQQRQDGPALRDGFASGEGGQDCRSCSSIWSAETTASSSTAPASLPTAEGKIILQAPPFEEFFGTVDLDCGVADERCLPGDDIETIRSALVLGIRDYARKNRFKTAVLGLVGRNRFGGGGRARL